MKKEDRRRNHRTKIYWPALLHRAAIIRLKMRFYYRYQFQSKHKTIICKKRHEKVSHHGPFFGIGAYLDFFTGEIGGIGPWLSVYYTCVCDLCIGEFEERNYCTLEAGVHAVRNVVYTRPVVETRTTNLR